VSVEVARFRSEPVEVIALQTAVVDPLKAKKDIEEHNRAVCKWISSHGVEVYMDRAGRIAIDQDEVLIELGPGDWVFLGRDGKFRKTTNEAFTSVFTKVE
jgi:DNA-binding transcriptional regulator/RsmH inhibitor MraZ